MPYAQLDVNAPDHWKVASLTDAQFRLWVYALCYCQKHLTDGVIDRRSLCVIMPKARPSTALALVKAGLWHQTDDGNFQLHDYADWNKTRNQVENKRKYDRDHKRSYTSRERVVNESDTSRVAATLRYATLRSDTQGQDLPPAAEPAPEAPKRDANGYVAGAAVPLLRRAGALPGRDPRMAFQCEAFSVPSFLHTKFIGKLANEHDGHPDETLLAWYRSIAARYDGQAVPADEVKWLTAEFDAWRKPKTAATADKQELSSEEWGKRMAERIMAKRASDAAKVTA